MTRCSGERRHRSTISEARGRSPRLASSGSLTLDETSPSRENGNLMDIEGELEPEDESMGLRFFLLVALSIALFVAAVAAVILIG